jgi:RNA polymerase sigma factor for flagellar operon FliA
MVSLDEITERAQGDDNLSLAERLPDPHAMAPDVALFLAEDGRLAHRHLRNLPKTQAMVIQLHYFQGIPLREVAKLLVVTPSRISQLHRQALGRLRQAYLRAQALP